MWNSPDGPPLGNPAGNTAQTAQQTSVNIGTASHCPHLHGFILNWIYCFFFKNTTAVESIEGTIDLYKCMGKMQESSHGVIYQMR